MLALKLILEPTMCCKRVDTLETQINKNDQRPEAVLTAHWSIHTCQRCHIANGEMIGLSTINGEMTVDAQEISK